MAGMAQAIKDEIIRLAEKEARKQTAALEKEIRDLRKAVTKLQSAKAPAVSGKKGRRGRPAKASSAAGDEPQLTGGDIRRLRAKLKLTQADMAKLLGVSAQSIYNWEKKRGAIRFRNTTRKAIVRLLDMDRDDAHKKLDNTAGTRRGRPSAKKAKGSTKTASAGADALTGSRIKKLRSKLKLTQAKLAKLLGVSAQSIYNWEKKKGTIRFRQSTRAAIARLLGMDREEVEKKAGTTAGRGRKKTAKNTRKKTAKKGRKKAAKKSRKKAAKKKGGNKSSRTSRKSQR